MISSYCCSYRSRWIITLFSGPFVQHIVSSAADILGFCLCQLIYLSGTESIIRITKKKDIQRLSTVDQEDSYADRNTEVGPVCQTRGRYFSLDVEKLDFDIFFFFGSKKPGSTFTPRSRNRSKRNRKNRLYSLQFHPQEICNK